MRTLGGEREVLTPTRLLLGIGPGLRANRKEPSYFLFDDSGIDKNRDCMNPINLQFSGAGWYKLLVMTGFSEANPKLSWSFRSFAAIGLGVGADFLAECLKFMAGA